eukprot:NODE_17818_length_924_cov_4.654956.p2 GENE.NODE_17818_length_924_cov_4.654956~~NODE_17818_length_924_cov_4.654956.p2  ORF type:complete len:154 (-),score=39.63 NODE_17818_length_924_cov_4.654956:343-804(-)
MALNWCCTQSHNDADVVKVDVEDDEFTGRPPALHLQEKLNGSGVPVINADDKLDGSDVPVVSAAGEQHISVLNGYWCQPPNTEELCEIRDGVVKWADVFCTPHGDIHLSSDGTVRMQLEGILHIATAVDATFNRLIWNDNDVWERRGPLPPGT